MVRCLSIIILNNWSFSHFRSSTIRRKKWNNKTTLQNSCSNRSKLVYYSAAEYFLVENKINKENPIFRYFVIYSHDSSMLSLFLFILKILILFSTNFTHDFGWNSDNFEQWLTSLKRDGETNKKQNTRIVLLLNKTALIEKNADY